MAEISIKHNKHRAYPTLPTKKIELLQKLLLEHQDKNIIVVSSQVNKELTVALNDINNAKVTLIDDKTLYQDKELKTELLISFDVPQKAIVYISRLSHTTDTAYVLVSKDEENLLYPVERLLGRAIKQEVLKEFSDVTQLKTPEEREAIKERKREKNLKDETPTFKSKAPASKEDEAKAKQWEKKKKAPSKYLGKDEHGKSQFSGKTGDRNHSFDGTPRERKDYKIPKKTGRSVSIKGLNKKED